jgi:glycosyltransferase involved in cell wall biosynthesis
MIEITGWIDYEKVHEYLTGDIGIIFFEKAFNAYYSMPNKLFNYINAGLPILSVQCAESSELITTNKIGVIVERDINSIREGLHELITNYDYYQQNVRNAQKLFSWKNEEIKLLSLYKNLLNHDA